MTDQPTILPDPVDDPLFEEMDAAIDGAYCATPSGEGVMGALYFAARAAVLVARGMKAPEAVAAAIGNAGQYGVPRIYGVIPRPETMQVLCGSTLSMTFKDDAERDLAIKGVQND